MVGSLVFVFPGWRRRSPFLSGDLDFTSLNQDRNSIPDEFLKFGQTPGMPSLHIALLRPAECHNKGSSETQVAITMETATLNMNEPKAFT